MQELLVSELKEHPKYEYFFNDISGKKWDEFLESLQNRGSMVPILITPNKVIVSGHEKVRACKKLGVKTVVVDVRLYDSADAILKDMLDHEIKFRIDRGEWHYERWSARRLIKLGRIINEYERLRGIEKELYD